MPGTCGSSDFEAIAAAFRCSSARVRRLIVAVEAEEGALVHAAVAEVAAVTRSAGGGSRASKHTEQQLNTRLRRSRQLLQEERRMLQDALHSSDDRARRRQLAVAVENGTSQYFSDVRAVRQQHVEVTGATAGAAQPGSTLRRLREEERRLDEAVGSLQAEIHSVEVDEVAALQQRHILTNALQSHEHNVLSCGR